MPGWITLASRLGFFIQYLISFLFVIIFYRDVGDVIRKIYGDVNSAPKILLVGHRYPNLLISQDTFIHVCCTGVYSLTPKSKLFNLNVQVCAHFNCLFC